MGPIDVDLLQQFSAPGPDKQPLRSESDIAVEVETLAAELVRATSYAPALRLPQSHFARGINPDSLSHQVAIEARSRALVSRHNHVLDKDKLDQLFDWLKEHSEYSATLQEDRINYAGYQAVRDRCLKHFGAGCAGYCSASAFLRLTHDGNGCVSVLSVFEYINKRSNLFNHRLNLSWYDLDCDGCLTAADIGDFVSDMVPDMPQLSGMDPAFLPHYRQIAAAKFIFYHGRQGRVRIRDMVGSPVLDELYEMHRDSPHPDNWFALEGTMDRFHLFQQLDRDGSGGLSREELMDWRTGVYDGQLHPTMTPLFVDRLFEEHVGCVPDGGDPVARGDMSFGEWLRLLLVWKERGCLPSVRYLFQVLDFRKQGYITQEDIYCFFAPVAKMWVQQLQMFELSVQDVRDEIFDMVKPAHRHRITLEDLMASTRGDVIPYMLIDVEEFFAHDQKESQMPQEEPDF